MNKKFNSPIGILVLVAGGLACSSLRPKRPPTLIWYLTLEVDSAVTDREAAVKETVVVIRKRLDTFGISGFEVEPVAAAQNRILVKLPGVPDHERLKQVITAGGRLNLTPVMSLPSPWPLQTFKTEEQAAILATKHNGEVTPYVQGESRQFLILEKTPIVTGEDLRSANAVPAAGSDRYSVNFTLRREGAERLGAWTKSHIDSYLAVVLNDSVVSAPYVKGEIRDSGEIAGNYSKSEAEDLAQVLSSGALPAPVKIVGESFLEIKR